MKAPPQLACSEITVTIAADRRRPAHIVLRSEVTMEFLMFDTVIATSEGREYSDEIRAEHPHKRYLPEDAPSAQEQWDWLEARLKNSTADYLWVAGHYPVWSGCSHGPDKTMLAKLKPWLEQ